MDFGILSLPLMLLGLVVGCLAIIFILVPLLKGIGWGIANLFRGIGWLFAHLFEYIFGTIGDAIRFVGSIPVWLVFITLSLLNVVIGRWSAAGHFMNAGNREMKIAGLCLYRIGLRRPLKLLWLHGLLEGFEQRVPQAFGEAPGSDKPSRRTGRFDGYTIVGSLKGGGSGGKLYIAEPTPEKLAAIPAMPERVVIKSFALSDGSSLPQIVRESRALECAKALGHVLEHSMDPQRFYYVMPYIPGEHLGVVARDLHAASDGRGLAGKQLGAVMDHVSDLLATLSAFHSGGFWHKDVKPDNIIVNDGRAHLVDLGLVTALRSAMTLTTHGTEYFRDPEMVRQALRGVKVHQVDGAKFDIYAAGAVLYFLLENTFPAHGGLSAFQKKSPEALHWIVRRAMADYHQRYARADLMLADLHFVNSHSDPWKVKPADLPSMKGAEIPDVPVAAPDPVKVVHAATPAPRGPAVPPPAPAAPFSPQPTFGGSPSTAGGRPRLRVTNWWTGEYVVDGSGQSAHGPVAASVRSTPRAYPSVGGHRPAKEQLAAARRRAHEARTRAKSRRATPLRAPAEKQPGVSMVLGLLVLVALVIAAVMLVPRLGSRSSGFAAPRLASFDAGPAVMLVNDHTLPNHPDVQNVIDSAVRSYTREGYDVFIADQQEARSVVRALRRWWDDRSRSADRELEDLMADANVYGIVHVTGEGPRNVTPRFVRSTRGGAEDRRRITPIGDGDAVVVVNDYPERDMVSSLDGEMTARLRQHIGHSVSTVVQDVRFNDAWRVLIEAAEAGDSDAEARIIERLSEIGASAVVWFEPDEDYGGVRTHIQTVDASDRRAAGEELHTPSGSFENGRMLILNNHPALAHERVLDYIESARDFYADFGFSFVDDVALEVQFRTVIAKLPADVDVADAPAVHALLDASDLDAVLIIERGTEHTEAASDDLASRLIELDPAHVSDDALANSL